MPTEKILVAQVFSLQRQVIYQIKAKRLNYLIKDFILSNFKRRLSFLLLNSEVSSLLLMSGMPPFVIMIIHNNSPSIFESRFYSRTDPKVTIHSTSMCRVES